MLKIDRKIARQDFHDVTYQFPISYPHDEGIDTGVMVQIRIRVDFVPITIDRDIYVRRINDSLIELAIVQKEHKRDQRLPHTSCVLGRPIVLMPPSRILL